MKKEYMIPTMDVVNVAVQNIICTSLPVVDGDITNPLAPSFDDDDLDNAFEDVNLDGFFK